MLTSVPTNRLFAFMLLVSFLLISACSDDGPSTQENQNTNTVSQDFSYSGPAPLSDDIQRFQENLWPNIIDTQRCGGCHSVEGGREPLFARVDDINKAYSAVESLVDLTEPEASLMVAKLDAGHSCWESETNICAQLLTRWISNWANVAIATANQVELKAPVIKTPGSSKNFPEDSSAFKTEIYDPFLNQYCQDCHRDGVQNSQSPFIASVDVDEAYLAAQNKINLDSPELSRLVVRLKDEFHNCWSDCDENSAQLLAAIERFAGGITLTQVNPDHVISKSMQLFDGIISSSGGRNEDSLIALYEFKTGTGAIAYDTSGIDKAMNLQLKNNVEWVGGWGINFIDGKAQALVDSSEKLSRLIKATGQYSIETWVAPNNVAQEGPARIVSYSAGNNDRNFMLGQSLYNYNFHHRSSVADANGEPALSTMDDDEVLQATLQHVVITYDNNLGRSIYVNGVKVAQESDLMSDEGLGDMSGWDNSYAFVLGSETSNQHRFKGVIRLVAVYNKALPLAQIQENFDANVGQRYFVMFNVSEHTGINEAYVVFEVSQFDNYSYLFNAPFFVSLDDTADFSGVELQGMHIGINGKRAIAGQAFNHVNTSLNSESADELGRQSLSTLGTIIGLEKGVAADEFYLIFDQLGDESFVIVDADPIATPVTPSTLEQADIGLKTFDEINLSMARLTGIDPAQVDVAETFTRIKQQLPSTTKINTFLASQQVGISQLAIEYCSVLVDDSSKRSVFFPGLNFTNTASTVLNDKDALLIPLYEKMVINTVNGTALTSEPSNVEMQPILETLIAKLSQCESNSSCAVDRVQVVAKAVCATVLASAIGTVQ